MEALKEIARQSTQAIVRLEARMDQGFAELRREMNSNFKWMMGTFLTGFLFLLGLMGRIAGLY